MLFKFFFKYLKVSPQTFDFIVGTKSSRNSAINPNYSNMVFGKYDPKLLIQLTYDHRKVMAYCDNIAAFAKNDDWLQVNIAIIDLMNIMCEHRKVEFRYLYARLEYSYKTKSEEHDMINFIRKEMKKTSTSFFKFCEYHLDISESPQKQQSFYKEFLRQHYSLKTKIELEESSLFPIYDLLYKKH